MMQDSKNGLLDGVKTTVAKFGLIDFSTRKLSEVTGINNGLIYHYFNSIEEVLLLAYCKENGAIFNAMIHQIDEIHNAPLDFEMKLRLWFHKTWREFLSDPDRLEFCTAYYHSIYFKSAEDFHAEQLKKLIERYGSYFKTENECVQTMYSLLTLLYDSAKRVIDGSSPDTPETEDTTFTLFYGMLSSQLKAEDEHEL